MVCTKNPPAALRLPVALFAFALASAVTADDPVTRPGRAEIPPYVTQRIDLLIHEPTSASPDPGRTTERKQERTPPIRTGG